MCEKSFAGIIHKHFILLQQFEIFKNKMSSYFGGEEREREKEDLLIIRRGVFI